jgi:hypothetical protein
MRKRRYEILLPLKFNDGREVPPELFEQCREELVAIFGGVNLQPNIIRGIWIGEGLRYEDELLRLVIDVEENDENHAFFKNYKATLLERFEQLEIYITFFPIDIL